MIYLAAPYTHADPLVCDIRAKEVTYAAAILTEMGMQVYSPITHGHAIAKTRPVPIEFEYWQIQCEVQLAACDRLAVLMLPGWDTSTGVRHEIRAAMRDEKRIAYIDFEDVL